MATTLGELFDRVKAALERVGFTASPFLLGNRTAPSPVAAGSFRLNPGRVRNGADDGRRRDRVDTVSAYELALTVHLTHPRSPKDAEASYKRAAADIEQAIRAVATDADLRLVAHARRFNEVAMRETENFIESDLAFTIAYDFLLETPA